MKTSRIYFKLSIVLFSLCFVNTKLHAQEQTEISDTITTAKTVANHSISINNHALFYSYEHPLGRLFTLEGRAGVQIPIGYTKGSTYPGLGYIGKGYRLGYTTKDGIYLSAHPYLELTPRLYYNLNRRIKKGKRTQLNSANFFALSVQHIFKPVATLNAEGYSLTSITPHWGLRRVYLDWLLLEVALGANYNRDNYGTKDWDPYIDVRVGYVF